MTKPLSALGIALVLVLVFALSPPNAVVTCVTLNAGLAVASARAGTVAW